MYHDQLTELSPADLTGTDTTGNGISVNPISFYDEVADKLIINCAVSLKFPDGTTGSVNAQAVPLTFLKPTVSWTVGKSFGGYTQGFRVVAFLGVPYAFGANELWGPITITEPPALIPNGSGYGCVAQIANFSRSLTRTPQNNAPAVFSHILVKFGNNTTGMVAGPTGLDGAFPYPLGYPRNTDGTWGVSATSQFSANIPGYSGDGPQQPFTISAPDNGGNSWYSSTADDGFITTVMYEPPTYGGKPTIFVPLQLLYWSWGGHADLINNSWSVTQSPMFSPGSPSNVSTPPAWTLEIPGPFTFGP